MTIPVVLVVCDGWGENPDPYGNAIAAGRTPNFDRLRADCAFTVIGASGEAVGVPPGQQGNSEVGHLAIGSGRVLHQPLVRINRAIADGSFFENEVLCRAIDRARERGRRLHCLGMISPGGVHSHQAHALALVEMAGRRGLQDIFIHAFTDGRDEPPSSAAEFLRGFTARLDGIGTGRVASVSGRYYAMDRDHRWERTDLAYRVITGDGVVATSADAVAHVEAQYALGITDEFIRPASLPIEGGSAPVGIEDGDSVVFFNFRPDRARQLSHALADRDFSGFSRRRVMRDLAFVTFTEYEAGLRAAVAFPAVRLRNTLAEVVSDHGLRQFHLAETEKYAHVTYFFNGGREEPFPGEERVLIPSPPVATYDTTPAMSARAVTDALVARIDGGGDALLVVNFANADMVGHTGDFAATVAAVEVVDECVGRIAAATAAAGGAVLVTADHGNAELKLDRRDNTVLTAHTTSAVPLIVCGLPQLRLRAGGGLADIAPTVLDIMNVPVPEDMTGHSLLLDGVPQRVNQ